MKKILRYYTCILIAPIVIVHELLHVFMSIMVMSPYNGISFGVNGFILTAELKHKASCFVPKYKRIMMSYAPLLSPITVMLLSFFHPLFIYVLIYFIVANIHYFLVSGYFIGLFISRSDMQYANSNLTVKEYNDLIEKQLG